MGFVAFPEALAGAAHIPVGEHVAEPPHFVAGAGDVGVVEGVGDVGHQVVQFSQDVPVKDVGGVGGDAGWGGGVQFEEAVGVPHGQQGLPHAFPDTLLGDDEVAAAQDGAGHEEPAHGVGSVPVKHLVDIRVVSLGLAHFEPIVAKHNAMGHNLFERRAVEQGGGEHVQGIEPAAGLAGVFHDEIRRGMVVEPFFVFERVVFLGERHGAGFEPAVEDFRHPPHGGFPGGIVRVGPGEFVDVWPVQRGRAHPEITFEFVQGAVHIDPRVFFGVGHPHGDGRAPVAVAGDVPVAGTFEPFAELAVPNVFGHPFDPVVVEFDHAVPEFGDRHEPGGQRHVDEWLPGPPRVRVGVFDGLVAEDPTGRLEVPDDVFVSVEHQHVLVGGHEGGEFAVHVHRNDHADASLLAGNHVVFAECGGLMHHASAVFGGHIVGDEDAERIRLIQEEVVGGLVSQARQLLANVCVFDFIVAEFFGVSGNQVVGQQVAFPVGGPHHGIGDVRVDGDGQVGGQGPRRGRPDESVDAGERGPERMVWGVHQRHGDGDRGVLPHFVGVVQAGFLVGEGCVFGPGIGQHPESLVDQAVIVEGLERPHDGFHEIQVHGFVTVIEIDPPGLPGDVGFPFLRVLQHALGAVLVEFFQAHGLDLAFVFDAQLFFGL